MPIKNSTLSRRSTIKFLAGVPLLPMAAVAIESETAFGSLKDAKNCAHNPSKFRSKSLIQSLQFSSMPAPTLNDPKAMASTTVGSSLTINYSDGSKQNFPLAYQPFFITGDQVPNGMGGTILAGGYYDINNQKIIDSTSPDQQHFFSDCPDGMSLIKLQNPKVEGCKGNIIFAVIQFEYTSRDVAGVSRYGQLPSPIAVLTLDQDPLTGRLKLVKYFNIDTSPAKGLWITCGSSLSPWNTHLSSEEYEPDATNISSNLQFQAFSQNLYGLSTAANPYHYGHVPEITVNPDGTGTIKKHYCLGRISHEVVQVLPDERTVLMGDDATNGGAFMFVADRPRDLSSGTLYVGKWLQKTSNNGGSADLRWIRLGHASSEEILALADSIQASDIIDVQTSNPNNSSYTKIRFSGKDNWVQIVAGQEQAAAFLETHRYAAYKGGSLGFTKWEGTTVNAKDKVAYVAMSYIQSSMIDGTTDVFVQGPRAGAIYAMNLRGGQVDDTGRAIESDWVPVDMGTISELIGEDLSAPDAIGNLANAEKIANPDNIKYSENLRTLFIGEDSAMHVNNFLWAYNIDTKSLTRLLSCPAGAESTGLHSADEINGFTYITSNFQHPGDWELTKDANGNITGGLHAKVFQQLDPIVKNQYKNRFGAATGYLTGLPAFISHLDQ